MEQIDFYHQADKVFKRFVGELTCLSKDIECEGELREAMQEVIDIGIDNMNELQAKAVELDESFEDRNIYAI